MFTNRMWNRPKDPLSQCTVCSVPGSLPSPSWVHSVAYAVWMQYVLAGALRGIDLAWHAAFFASVALQLQQTVTPQLVTIAQRQLQQTVIMKNMKTVKMTSKKRKWSRQFMAVWRCTVIHTETCKEQLRKENDLNKNYCCFLLTMIIFSETVVLRFLATFLAPTNC